MKSAGERAGKTWLETSSQQWKAFLRDREEQVFLVLTLLIGAIVGMVVVAFILLTERSGARLYPAGGAAWRRLLVPVAGSALMGYLLYRLFPDARGSGVPQTKAALYARGGRRPHCTLGADGFHLARWWENSSALRRRLPAAFRSAAKVRRFKLGPGSLQCLAEDSGCARRR